MESRHDQGAGKWVTRVDRGSIGKPHVRPDGTLLVEGVAAKEGVLEYRQADGSVIREFVSAEVLADSAVTLARSPLTLGHPPEDVTPENVDRYSVGDVDGLVRVEANGFVHVAMAVRKRDAIDAVRGGTQELSCGYRARVDYTPGEHPVYGRYDGVQLERVTNHLAIVDTARAGHGARIRVDGVATTVIRAEARRDSKGAPMNRLAHLLALLGVTARLDSDEGMVDAAIDAVKSRKDASDAIERQRTQELANATAERDREKARADALAAERDREKARADAAEAERNALKAKSQERADADERAVLEGVAEHYSVDPAKHPQLADLRRAVAAAHLGGELRADAGDAYVQALVDLARQRVQAAGRQAGNAAWGSSASGKQDGAGSMPRKSSRDRYLEALGLGPKQTGGAA